MQFRSVRSRGEYSIAEASYSNSISRSAKWPAERRAVAGQAARARLRARSPSGRRAAGWLLVPHGRRWPGDYGCRGSLHRRADISVASRGVVTLCGRQPLRGRSRSLPLWSATLSPKVAAWCHAGLVIMYARSRHWSVAAPVVSGPAAGEPYDRGEQCELCVLALRLS